MSNHGDGLRAGILAAPHEVSRWLVYADWLSENDFEPVAVCVRDFARLLAENESTIRRFIALRASGDEADLDHRHFCESLYASEENNIRSAIETLIRAHEWMIYDSEDVAGAMADTNASDYGLDDVEVREVVFFSDRCEAEFAFRACGEQLDGRIPSGDTLIGLGTITVAANGEVNCSNLSAHVWFEDEDSANYDEGLDM